MAFYGNYYYIFFLKMSWLYKKSKATYTFDFNITILIIWHKRNKPYTYLHRIWLNHSITWVYYAFQSIKLFYSFCIWYISYILSISLPILHLHLLLIKKGNCNNVVIIENIILEISNCNKCNEQETANKYLYLTTKQK